MDIVDKDHHEQSCVAVHTVRGILQTFAFSLLLLQYELESTSSKIASTRIDGSDSDAISLY
jgi:hypothetical protein